MAEDLFAPIQAIIDAAQTLLSGEAGALGDQHSTDVNSILNNAYQLYDLVSETSDDLLPDAAPDITTLLMSILGFSQLILDYPEIYGTVRLSAAQRKHIKQISASSEHMRALVASLKG
jgi:hypothetical protein